MVCLLGDEFGNPSCAGATPLRGRRATGAAAYHPQIVPAPLARVRPLPEDKSAAVRELREQYGLIAMVGAGVNDAPALANADLAIAMGVAATDVALETADVALMADELDRPPAAIRLSRRARNNIKINIALSLAGVAVLITAGLTGWMSLTTGLLLNEGSAALIILNGLRLLTPGRGESRRKRTVAVA